MRLLFFLLLAVSVSAQESSPSLFTTEIEYQLEQLEQLEFKYDGFEKRLKTFPSYLQTIKMDQLQEEHLASKYLTQSLIDRLLTARLIAYDLDSKQALSPSEIDLAHQVRDSITMYDDDSTTVLGWQILTNDLSPQINQLRIKQTWEISERGLKLNVEEITPILVYPSELNGQIIKSPLYQIPMPPASMASKDPVNDPDITWIKFSVDYFAINEMGFDQQEKNLLQKLLWDNPQSGKTPIYTPAHSLLHPRKAEPIDFQQTISISNQIDTIITFHPQTYEEQMTVLHYQDFQKPKLVGFKLAQLWCWNAKNNTLNSIPLGIAPVGETTISQQGHHLEHHLGHPLQQDTIYRTIYHIPLSPE